MHQTPAVAVPVDRLTLAVREARVDEVLAESFPASDPPPWTTGASAHWQLPMGRRHRSGLLRGLAGG